MQKVITVGIPSVESHILGAQLESSHSSQELEEAIQHGYQVVKILTSRGDETMLFITFLLEKQENTAT